VIKYTSCDTVVFDYIKFSKFHTHNGDDTLPGLEEMVGSATGSCCDSQSEDGNFAGI